MPFFVWEDNGRNSSNRFKLVPVNDCLSRDVAISGGSFSHFDLASNRFLLLSRTGGALSFFVDSDPASEVFVVRFVGSRDRIVPFGPGRVYVCIAIKKSSSRHFKYLTGHVSPPVFKSF